MRTLCMISQIQQQRSFGVRLASTWWMQIQYSLSFLFWSRLDRLLLELLFRYIDKLIVVHLSADWCWTQVIEVIASQLMLPIGSDRLSLTTRTQSREFYPRLASCSVTLSPLSFLRPLWYLLLCHDVQRGCWARFRCPLASSSRKLCSKLPVRLVQRKLANWRMLQ